MPGRPLVLSFSSREVNLSWTPPAQADGEMREVEEYIVRVRRGENSSWSDSQAVRTETAVSRFTVVGLQPFTVYSFRVVAVFAGPEREMSGESAESYYMITLRELPTGSPTITAAHNITSTALYLAWEPAHPLTIHGEFLGYKLSYQARHTDKAATKQSIVIPNPSTQEFILRDLETYTQYNVAIQVINPEGAGPAAKVTVMTDEGVPSAPMYTTVHTITNTTAVVDWSRPHHPNGVIDGYRLYFLSGNLTEVKTIKSKDPRLEFRLSDLDPASLYYVWIKAFTWKNEGVSSSKLSIRTDVTSPSPPVISNISCHENRSITVSWSACSYSHCVYTLRLRPGAGEDIRLTGETASLTTPPLQPLPGLSLSVEAATLSLYRSELTYSSGWGPSLHLELPQCRISSEQQQPDSSLSRGEEDDLTNHLTPPLIAGIVLAVLLFLLVTAGLVLWRLFCGESYYYLEESASSPSQPTATSWETETTHRVTAEQFLAQVKTLHLDDDKEFVVEFRNIVNKNNNNNRRVEGGGSYEQQFSVDGYNAPKAYIATPLPLNYKFNFFWKQVWEKKVGVIVMLEAVVVGGKVMCEQYWPETREVYGQVEVRLERTERLAHLTSRTFLLSHTGLGRKAESRRVLHLQFTSWPLQSNPANPLALITFTRLAISQQEVVGGPMVVHTNPTNSRAGIFITFSALLKQMRTTAHINIKSFLSEAPQRGQSLLRSVKDYIYIHDMMVEYIVAGETNIKKSYISRYINSLQSSLGQTSLLHRQTDLINVDFVKKEKSLEAVTGQVWLPGHHSLSQLLLMSYPSQQDSEVAQIWRLVLEHNVHTIVVLKSQQKTTFPDLSLTEDCGLVSVTHRDDEISYEFKSKNFIIQYGASVRKCVKVIFSEHFMSDTEPVRDSLKLVETVVHRMNSLNRAAPVIVLDNSLTADNGAVFCSLLTLLQQNQAEQHCDVYQALKTVNLARRGVWTNQEKLLRIYKLVELMMLGNTSSDASLNNNNNLAFQHKKSQFRISINSWKHKSKAVAIPVATPVATPNILSNGSGWF